jgi:hypothetical protein
MVKGLDETLESWKRRIDAVDKNVGDDTDDLVEVLMKPNYERLLMKFRCFYGRVRFYGKWVPGASCWECTCAN